MKNSALIVLLLLAANISAQTHKEKGQKTPQVLNSKWLIDLNRKLSDILVYDKFSPPVSSRTFAYANLAARSAGGSFDKITYPKIELTNPPKATNAPDGLVVLSMLKCFDLVAYEMVYSQAKWKSEAKSVIDAFILENKIDNAIVTHADSAAKAHAAVILKWASTDGYSKRLSFKKYEVYYDVDSTWKPTAPSYGLPVEPYWGTIRLFYLPSVNDFLPDPSKCIPFSSQKGSPFYNMVNDVYLKSVKMSKKDMHTAFFWDCNPVQQKDLGHLILYNFRLTPAAHWILLVSDIVKQKDYDIYYVSKFYSDLAMGMSDAFVVCWKSKYDNNEIRPETYINKYIAKSWKPMIETPTFPEYPSGHSAISMTAAKICNAYLGENLKFTDATETEYNLKPKKFKNFEAAAYNAGISRYYGGIHYMPSILDGLKMGNNIGTYIVNKIDK